MNTRSMAIILALLVACSPQTKSEYRYVERLLHGYEWACAPHYPVIWEDYYPEIYCKETDAMDFMYSARTFDLPESEQNTRSLQACLNIAEGYVNSGEASAYLLSKATFYRYNWGTPDIAERNWMVKRSECVGQELQKRQSKRLLKVGSYSCCFFDSENDVGCVPLDARKDRCYCSFFLQYRGGEDQLDIDARKIEAAMCKLE